MGTKFKTNMSLLVFLFSAAMAILVCLTAVILTRFFEPNTSRRPKTNLIFNNPELCSLPSEEGNNRKNVVVVVISARSHLKQRNLVRQTYGSIRTANNIDIFKVVFMLGSSDGAGDEKTDNNVLANEMNEFGDIVMGDFVDSYRHLTLKTIMAYEWVTTFCRRADIIVKTDDDVMINIFQLTKLLDAWPTAQIKSSNIWCMIHKNENTIEEPDSKYYASREEFPDGMFPDHCGGLGYVTSMIVIERILDEISKSFLGYVCTHEDVFMTAIVPQRINSKSKWFWQRLHPPIELVSKRREWFTLHLENMRDPFLGNALRQSILSSTDIKRIRKRYKETIFYLMAHTDDYDILYIRLWQVVQKIFSQ